MNSQLDILRRQSVCLGIQTFYFGCDSFGCSSCVFTTLVDLFFHIRIYHFPSFSILWDMSPLIMDNLDNETVSDTIIVKESFHAFLYKLLK